ncbi:MAG: hypothetical protein A2V70_13955 [Planctomycetes bacterium RBG_13_63_9]|nr:MAG: hypothetical protein A2V70_13955 [Planctomycetes bacterium RBG_13_63_9]
MKIAASIELVMQLAAQEATSGRFKEIEPPHIVAAILKFAELPVEEVDRAAPGSDAAKQLAAEVRAVRKELAARGIDSTQARRKLRAELGRGDAPPGVPPQHRSAAAREVFDAATRIAERKGDALKAEHLLAALLASPSPLIVKVLGNALKTQTWQAGDVALLEKHGQDLTKLAAEGKLPAVKGREAERKALIRTIAEGGKRAVVLITDNIEAIRQLVASLAQAIAKEEVPASLKGARIVDISALDTDMGMNTTLQPQLEDAFAEAARAENLWLLTPAIEPHVASPAGNWWHDPLRVALEQGDVRMICPATPTGYLWVKDDPVWKRWASAMRLQETIEGEVPQEL